MAALAHFMADAEDPVLDYEKGLSIISKLSKPPYPGQRAELAAALLEAEGAVAPGHPLRRSAQG